MHDHAHDHLNLQCSTEGEEGEEKNLPFVCWSALKPKIASLE